MGAFGLAFNGIKAVVGLVIDDSEMVDKALENGQKSLQSFLYDPIGGTDAIDEVTNL